MPVIKLIRRIFSFLFAGVIALSASFGSVIGYTEGETIMAAKRNYCFDNDGLIIGAYSFNRNSKTEQLVSYAKEAGIQFLISGAYEEYLDICDRNEMGVIASNYNTNAPYMYWKAEDSLFEQWQLITQESYNYSHDCIWGDNLIDEPIASLMPNIGKAVNHYYKNTTGKLPFVNLFPMYANEEQLGNVSKLGMDIPFIDSLNMSVDRYKMHVSDYINNIDTDYISVDIYPLNEKDNGDGTFTKTTYEYWLRNLDILAEACRETNRDLWVITQAAGLSESNQRPRHCDTVEDIRWQAFVSLAFGTKAIIHACYYGGWWDADSHMIDGNGNRTDTYYAVQTVDKELAAFADIYGEYESKGAYLVNGSDAAGNGSNYLTPVKEEYKPVVCSDDPILVGCFDKSQDDGTAYSVVNMWEPELNKSANAKLYFEGAKEITVYRQGAKEVISGDTLYISLASSEGVFVTVK